MQAKSSMNWEGETSPSPCIPRNGQNPPRIRPLFHVDPISQNDQPRRKEKKLLTQVARTDEQSLSYCLWIARLLRSYQPPGNGYCFSQNRICCLGFRC